MKIHPRCFGTGFLALLAVTGVHSALAASSVPPVPVSGLYEHALMQSLKQQIGYLDRRVWINIADESPRAACGYIAMMIGATETAQVLHADQVSPRATQAIAELSTALQSTFHTACAVASEGHFKDFRGLVQVANLIAPWGQIWNEITENRDFNFRPQATLQLRQVLEQVNRYFFANGEHARSYSGNMEGGYSLFSNRFIRQGYERCHIDGKVGGALRMLSGLYQVRTGEGFRLFQSRFLPTNLAVGFKEILFLTDSLFRSDCELGNYHSTSFVWAQYESLQMKMSDVATEALLARDMLAE